MAEEEDTDRLRLLDNERLTEESDDLVETGAYTIQTHDRVRFLGGLKQFSDLNKSKNVYLTSIIVAVSATLTCVLFPSFLKAANDHSDAYCALIFSSICSTTLLALAIFAYKLCFHRALHWKPVQISYPRIIQLGTLYGLCGLLIFYSRDRNRVMCHLQDPLAAVLLPATVSFHMFQAKVDKISQLICMAGAIIGLFVSVDFQMWDEFSCHGDIIVNSQGDGDGWSSKVHVSWTLSYVATLTLLAFFYVCLEKQIKILSSETNCVSIPLEGVAGSNEDVNFDQPSTSEEPPTPLPTIFNVNKKSKNNKFHFANILVLFLWVQFISTVTIVFFFWTDFLAVFGKAGSASNFNSLMRSGWSCYFGVGDRCSKVAGLAWTFIFSYLALFSSLIYLMTKKYSVNYVMCVTILCLPLSTIWWSFIQTGEKWQWSPVFSGETGFTVVGLPIMMVALVLYTYYADNNQTN